MKPICINATPLCGRITGIERYMHEIIIRLDALLAQQALSVTAVYPEGKKVHLPELKHIKLLALPCYKDKISIRDLRRYLKQSDSLYCSLSGNLCVQKNAVICIHDIRPWIYKQYDSSAFRLRCAVNFISAKLFAKKIITVSETSKNEIRKHLHVSPERLDTIANGWEHMLTIQADERVFARYPQLVKGNYYYSLGSQAPHKNFHWVTQVAKHNPDAVFAVAGKLWDNGMPPDAAPKLHYLGYVTDEENKALMQNCKAFLFPSRYEGFGIPPLEAAACGADICISSASCLPEIFGDCAHYFDPDDVQVDLAALCMEPAAPAEKLLEKYSWDRSAKQWLDLFKQMS